MIPIKTLLVSHGSGLGGAERVLFEAVQGFDRDIIAPTIVVPEKGPLFERARDAGVPVVVSPAPWWLPFADTDHPSYQLRRYWEQVPSVVQPLVTLIERRGIDVVYSASSPILHAGLAAHLTRRPHLQHMQDLLGWPHLNFHYPLGSPALAYYILGQFASQVVCVGQTSLADIGRSIPREKCRIVALGLPSRGASPTALPLPGAAEGAIRVGVVGVVDRRKGADLIAAIVRRACADVPDLHVCWAGAGDPALLQRLSTDAVIDGVPHLHFIGHTDRVGDFMASMDFLLHPARNETFPRVLLEGAAAGKAIVATRCGGGQEIVQHGDTGLVADVDDVAGLAQAVVRLAQSPQLRNAMGARARQWAEPFTLADYQRGMQQAFLDTWRSGPAIRSAMKKPLVDAFVTLPSRAMPPLRRLAMRGA